MLTDNLQGVNMGMWSTNYEVTPKQEYASVFTFPSQLPPLDFSGFGGFTNEWESSLLLDDHHGVPMEDMFLNHDLFYSSFDTAQSQPNFDIVPDVFYYNCGTEYVAQAEEQQQQLLLLDISNINYKPTSEEIKRLGKRSRESTLKKYSSSSNKLSRETISQYFYMPITQAARELNVGLTLLKKRCRELGIRRWPHRKLISLQTLIKNVQQEFGKEGEEWKVKEYLQILEQEKKLLEEIPDMELEDTTKRLRQAFFKANYKKRKLMGVIDSSSSKSAAISSTHYNPAIAHDENGVKLIFGSREVDDAYEDDEFKYVFADCFSCGNVQNLLCM